MNPDGHWPDKWIEVPMSPFPHMPSPTALTRNQPTNQPTNRTQMAIADKWIEVLKSRNDYQWDMQELCHTMTNRCACMPGLF